jgi:maleylpyruvate isomerase
MSLEDARKELIERQGSGARYDAPGAPSSDLLAVRRLTSVLARLINDLPDSSLSKGSETARTVAQAALAARRLGEALAAVRTAVQPAPIRVNLALPAKDIAAAATLPAHALRHLFDHTRVHLNVEWRDLTDSDWNRAVVLDQAAVTPVKMLPVRHEQDLKASIQALSAQMASIAPK